MDMKDAKNLVMQLTNAAYEAGLWKDHANKTMTPHWQGIAEKIGDEIVRHLTKQSSRPDNAEANQGNNKVKGMGYHKATFNKSGG